MKLAFRDIEAFVAKPDPKARVAVVYGPDSGLVVERAALIGKTQVPDLTDPFNVAILTTDLLMGDPARLDDEAFAQSLMGGNRLVIIKDGADALTPLIKEYLAKPSNDTLVIIEAGELGTKSSLRALAEKSANAAAVPCYVEDARDLSRFIQDRAREEGLSIDRDALATLSDSLVGDRAVARSEFEKLITYKWGDPDKTIRIADVQACGGDVRTRTFDELIHAVGLGNVAQMAASLSTLAQENTPAVAILRSMQGHFRRLYQVHLRLAEGMDAKSAMKTLNPPVFFKFEAAFAQQLKRWPPARIEYALNRLAEVEAQTKQTGMPPELITGKLLMDMSLVA